ncbi:MAG: CAP domain-containing protein [Betaproteobacteria bacterium]|nr:CAP domain-containing protein [Betaproteobacteria bacterium]
MTPLFFRFPASLLLIAVGATSAIAVTAQNPIEPHKPWAVASAPDVLPDLSLVMQQVIGRTNAFRKQENRRPVEADPRLSEAAAYFADYMARTSQYGHEADGGTPASRASRHGYEHCIISENIAYQYSSEGFMPRELASGLVEGWKRSPGHRRNMLDPDVSDTGVAVARSAKTGYYYAVQMFGLAKASSIAFTIANRSGTTVTYKLDDQRFPLSPRVTRLHARCRPTQLTLLPSGSAGEVPPVQPGSGDRFVVVRENGSLAIRKE